MKRRALAYASLAVAILAGCSGVDPDVAAVVNDEELTEDELFEQLGVSDDDSVIAAEQARAAITGWVAEQLLADHPANEAFSDAVAAGPVESDIACVDIIGPFTADVAATLLGDLDGHADWSGAVEAAADELGAPFPDNGYQGCQATSTFFAGLTDQIADLDNSDPFTEVALPDGSSFLIHLRSAADVPIAEKLGIAAATTYADTYNLGPVESGIVCSAHILVETEEEADEVTALLDDGASFAEVAIDRSLDPGSGAAGGALGCSPADQFSTTYVPAFVEAALGAEVGVPVVAESEFGFHIIRLQPFDAVSPIELAQFVDGADIDIAAIAEAADIEISPTYGYFDPEQGVLPLG